MTHLRKFVFKVTPRTAWEAACREGAYAGSDDDRRDGFIHLSLHGQLPGTLAKHFRNQDDLVLAQFETQHLGDRLRWEASRGGEDFPHLYAPLPTAHAIAVYALRLGDDGVPLLPRELVAC